MFHLRQEFRSINKSVAGGQLNAACSQLRRQNLLRSASGRRLAGKLVDKLVERAETSAMVNNLAAAWRDMSDAATIAQGQQADSVTRKMNRLVESTIEQADLLLSCGKTEQADRTIKLLTRRRILDRRADRIQALCQQLLTAEHLASRGQLQQARSMLQHVHDRHPELTFLEARIRSCADQQTQMTQLTGQLRSAINESAWGGVRQLTNQMLHIAPRNQLAMDALNRCEFKQHVAPQVAGHNEGQIDTARPQLTNVDSRHEADAPHDSTSRSSPPENRSPQIEAASQQNSLPLANRSFLLWIDGVGGYLICPQREVTIGRALEASGVELPLQADIRRRHLKIIRFDGGFVVEPLGNVVCEGKKLEQPLLLAERQLLDLGAGVQMKFDRSQPLGNSGRLEFTSRHRTEPWSDAVILMGNAIRLGPAPENHIVCPDWKRDLLIFRRGDEICFRGPDAYEAGGQPCSGDVALRPGLIITGDDFSIACETI